MTSKLYSHRIKDTDRVIQIRKVSQLLIRELYKSVEKPKPPINKVKDIDGKEVEEVNDADPVYLEQLNEWKVKITEKVNELLMERGVIVKIGDEEKAEIKELKTYWKSKHGKELEGSDQLIYVKYICVGTDEDIKELIGAIVRRTQATEEGIQQTLDSFRSDVQE